MRERVGFLKQTIGDKMRAQLYYVARDQVLPPTRWWFDHYRFDYWGGCIRIFRLFGVSIMVSAKRPVE